MNIKDIPLSSTLFVSRALFSSLYSMMIALIRIWIIFIARDFSLNHTFI